MDNGLNPITPPKKKRGRPPGIRKNRAQHLQKSPEQAGILPQSSALPPAEPSLTPATQQADGDICPHTTKGDGKQTLFSATLQRILYRDRTEMIRVARELEVAENTVYRWMNGSSDHPRPIHLKRLPEVLSEYRHELIEVINNTFGNVLGIPQSLPREISKDLYHQVLKLNAANADDEIRLRTISQTIFEQALLLLDPEHQGLAITYAKLMPPHEDGIHSLREVATRSSGPWLDTRESKAYLGSTTLAGNAATLQRLQTWNSIDNNHRILVEVDTFERSACAVPIVKGSHIAGVLIVSSTQPDFFIDPLLSNTIADFALLLTIALSQHDFYPFSLLSLRPMPALAWQRTQIAQHYRKRIIAYASKHATALRNADLCVQRELELTFEQHTQEMMRQQAQP